MCRIALLLWGFIFAFVACQSGDIQSFSDAERAAIDQDIWNTDNPPGTGQ